MLGSYRQLSMKIIDFENDMKKLGRCFVRFDRVICIGDLNYDF